MKDNIEDLNKKIEELLEEDEDGSEYDEESDQDLDSELGDTLDEKALDRDLLRKNTPSDIQTNTAPNKMKHSNSTNNAQGEGVGSEDSESGPASQDPSANQLSSGMGGQTAGKGAATQ